MLRAAVILSSEKTANVALVGVIFDTAAQIGRKLFGGFGLKVWILEVGQDIVSLAAMNAIIASFV